MADDIITRDAIRLSTDEIGGVHFPKNKLVFGGPDVAIDVTGDTPFPVADPAIVTALEIVLAAINAAAAGTQPISATSLPLPVGAATATGVAAVVTAIQTAMAATQPVSATTLPLPVGAATAAAQASILAAVDEMEALIAKVTPSSDPRPVVPHATNALPVVAKSLYVGGFGNVTLRAEGGSSDITFFNVPDGAILNVRATHVRATTTATNIVAY